MRQTWGRLLFLHWPLPEEVLRPLVPPRLDLETFQGRAWVGITPFSMWGVAPPLVPPAPLLSRSLEINVRTYVRLDGEPGIWFFSLDAENPLMVWGARAGYRLPYFRARMRLAQQEDTVRFDSTRLPGSPAAGFSAEWRLGEPLPTAAHGTLDYFLIERYALYAGKDNRLFRARIRHRFWPLRQAQLEHFTSTLLESHGLPTPDRPPLVHAQAAPLRVLIGAPRRV